MKLAKVVLDIQSNSFSRTFTYAICDEDVNSKIKELHSAYLEKVHFKNEEEFVISIGCIVVVPFGTQFKPAFVVEIFDEALDNYNGNIEKLKPIVFAVSKSYFNSDNVAFAKFIAHKYLSSYASCLRLFIPVGATAKLSSNDGIWDVKIHRYRKTDCSFIKKYINEKDFGEKEYQNFILTEGQNRALEAIYKTINDKQHGVYVLDGVTGSGKTEVYLRLIDKLINIGKTACVLVPEISLTPQTVSRFWERFGDKIAVLHSKMSAQERFNQLEQIAEGKVSVVIGARSALFSPLSNIGLIVIDEEQENSYKQDKNPRYLTRDCAEFLVNQQNAVLVLGSATPSIESLYWCQTKDNWHHLVLNQRTNNKKLPKIDIVDMGLEFRGGYKNLFSRKLQSAICEELKWGNKVILFHNRRGFANYMFCRSCGYTPKCPNCSTALTYHQKLLFDVIENGNPAKAYREALSCHHCGHIEQVPVVCPQCNSPYIAKYGAGTQSVEDQLDALLAENNIENVSIIRMDADTTKTKMGHIKCLEAFAKPGPAVLLGTQMIAKGLDYGDVTLVGVVLIDTNLSFPDFRSKERTFDLILQVAGRAGRDKLTGKVIVQTYNPENESIVLASQYKKDEFIDLELAKRRLLSYPPYTDLVNIIISGSKEDEVCARSHQIFELLEDYALKNHIENIEIMPETSCVLSKIRNKFRYHIIIKSKPDFDISNYISCALKLYKLKSSISVSVDVNPTSLL